MPPPEARYRTEESPGPTILRERRHLVLNLWPESDPCSQKIMPTHGTDHLPVVLDGKVQHAVLLHDLVRFCDRRGRAHHDAILTHDVLCVELVHILPRFEHFHDILSVD